jgi:hypothetical protein
LLYGKTSYKWQQKQDSSSSHVTMTQRAYMRQWKEDLRKLRTYIQDKVWFDSLSFEEKQKIYYMYMYGDTPNEKYMKQSIPGNRHEIRDTKIDKILK